MKWKMLGYAFVAIIKTLDAEDFKLMIDKLLDPWEEKFKDNTAFMAACGLFRAVCSIPDND